MILLVDITCCGFYEKIATYWFTFSSCCCTRWADRACLYTAGRRQPRLCNRPNGYRYVDSSLQAGLGTPNGPCNRKDRKYFADSCNCRALDCERVFTAYSQRNDSFDHDRACSGRFTLRVCDCSKHRIQNCNLAGHLCSQYFDRAVAIFCLLCRKRRAARYNNPFNFRVLYHGDSRIGCGSYGEKKQAISECLR